PLRRGLGRLALLLHSCPTERGSMAQGSMSAARFSLSLEGGETDAEPACHLRGRRSPNRAPALAGGSGSSRGRQSPGRRRFGEGLVEARRFSARWPAERGWSRRVCRGLASSAELRTTAGAGASSNYAWPQGPTAPPCP